MMRLTFNTGCERTANRPASDLVTSHNACPSCGERDMDRLVWEHDGESVRCATCGTIYNPDHRT